MKIRYKNRVRKEKVVQRAKGERNVLYAVKGKKIFKRVGHILLTNCQLNTFLKTR